MPLTAIPTFQKDVYKEFHVHAAHPDITETYGNFTNRHDKLTNIPDDLLGGRVCTVGIQYFILDSLIDEWNNGFFNLPKAQVCKAHSRIMSAIVGYKIDVTYLENLHDLGYLPLEIKALEEGTLVPYGVPTFTTRNTHPEFEWLSLMIETVGSQESWPMSTSATTSVAYQVQAKRAMLEAGMDLTLLPFMIHDFSSRGMFGKVAASMSGFAHLCSGSAGTDTIPSVVFAEKYYGADVDKELVGASVNATEHSITCPWKDLGEEAYATYLMTEVAPEGILAMVADTWDFWNWVTVVMPNLKDTIMARSGKLVTRPDSGDPVKILTGYRVAPKYGNNGYELYHDEGYEAVFLNGEVRLLTGGIMKDVGDVIPECEVKGLVECLWDTFGGTHTLKGYKLLDEHVGAIYGDAITLDRQRQINERLMAKGFAPQVVLGVGSYSFQYVTRDTHGSAMKATNVVLDGVDTPIFKDPKTDSKKKSAKGFLRVDKAADGTLTCAQNVTREEAEGGELKTVFLNGKITRLTTLAEIRQRVQAQI